MLQNLIDHDRVASHVWPDDPADDSNDSADDGNALAGVFYAVLIQVGIALVVLLLYWLF
jgi:hypothetical protein